MSPRDASQGYRFLVSALSLGQLLSWATVYYGFSSFVLPMMAELGWSKSTVMGANTLGLLVWGLATYAAGAAVDRGQARLLMTAGSACAAAGFALWATATHPGALYGAWILLGLASAATLYEPAFNVLARRFPGRYREAITAVTIAGGFASTLSFPLVAVLIRTFGWRGALWCLAALAAGVLVPLHAWALRGSGDIVAAPRSASADPATLRQALRMRSFWLLTLCFTGYSVVIAAFWAHAVPLLAAKGLDQAQVLSVLVWIGPAQVLGRVLVARHGANLPLRRLGIVVLLAVPGAMLMLALVHSTTALIAAACVYGVANGLVTIVRGALIPEYFGRAHVGRIGGTMSAIALISRAIGPLALAWWLLWVPGYETALAALALVGVLSALAFGSARRP
jgi:MFS family permease